MGQPHNERNNTYINEIRTVCNPCENLGQSDVTLRPLQCLQSPKMVRYGQRLTAMLQSIVCERFRLDSESDCRSQSDVTLHHQYAKQEPGLCVFVLMPSSETELDK